MCNTRYKAKFNYREVAVSARVSSMDTVVDFESRNCCITLVFVGVITFDAGSVNGEGELAMWCFIFEMTHD